jgi:L-aspartate oxidase
VPRPQTRTALWELAGLQRTAAGLRTLHDDPFPLARMVAACALAREESRGAHQRLDFPDIDSELDLTHAVVRDDGVELALEKWR